MLDAIRNYLLALCCLVLLGLLVVSGLDTPLPAWAQGSRHCSQPSTGVDITVDDTAGGVVLLTANLHRCVATIKVGAADIRIAPTGDTLDASTGWLLMANTYVTLGPEDGVTLGWKGIRTTGVSSDCSILEGIE